MEKIKNYIKKHKIITIISPIILIISLVLTTILILYTKKIYKNNEISTVSLSPTSSITSSVDQLLVDISKDEDITISTKDSEKDKQEEERKAEETKKKQQEEERKRTEEEQRIASLPSYYIKVNRSANTVTVYAKDANGNFTIPVKAMVCSTGYASPKSGVYSSKKIGTWHTLFGGVYGQYCTHITGDILFHSVPYLRYGDNASLEYWAYDRLGTTASAGCIRLTTADAQWIYYNCKNGTQVEFYSSPDAGPLGKPSATKISDEATPYRNWDPTDPNPNNPWRNKQVADEPKTDIEPQPTQQPVEQPSETKVEKEIMPKQEETEKNPQTNENTINQTPSNSSPSVIITSIDNTLKDTNTNTNNTTNTVNNTNNSNIIQNNNTNSSFNINNTFEPNTNNDNNTNNKSNNTNNVNSINMLQNKTN